MFEKLRHLSLADHRAIWEIVNFGMDFNEFYRLKAEGQGGVYQDIYTALIDPALSVPEKIIWSNDRLASLYSQSSDDAFAFQSFSAQLRSLVSLEEALQEEQHDASL